ANIHKTIVMHEKEKQHLLETQNERLENEVIARTREIATEKQKSDELLLNILPEEIAEELKEKGSSDARYYDNVTVIFTDFVDFTKAGTRLTPQELVNELDTCFKAFDNIAAKYQIEKIKTIGDAYLAVCGLPVADPHHAQNTVNAALEIMAFMKMRKQQFPGTTFDVRIGIHSGTVVAGIVGLKKFAYDIWGDTVNTAARMESSSEPNRINISQATYELVQNEFDCTYRGEIMAKNKGDMRMYFVESRK
ncbi:MAG TPA: adenylate/guanylate cyclase domain-containing protein, partial [Chitinophagaceae bacterium]|nr:adenylate/guanylate cyclase domain-containing protein [Chitinophagaceae bacterium]